MIKENLSKFLRLLLFFAILIGIIAAMIFFIKAFAYKGDTRRFRSFINEQYLI